MRKKKHGFLGGKSAKNVRKMCKNAQKSTKNAHLRKKHKNVQKVRAKLGKFFENAKPPKKTSKNGCKFKEVTRKYREKIIKGKTKN